MGNIISNDSVLAAPQFRRLSEGQCKKIYWACLEILERTGVRLYSQEALDLLKKAGVAATDGNRVRIPHGLVEKALGTAPRRFTWYDRNGEAAMRIEGYRSYFGTGSDCLHIIDHRTNGRRRAVLQDVVEGMRVVDALPNIDFAMCMFLPEDVEQMVVDRYQMEAMINNTTKPVMFVTNEFSGAVDAVEMAQVVAGGEDALRRKPYAACYVNVTTGLVHNEEALQKLLYFSEKGVPFAYVPSIQGGVTGPVTPVAAMAVAQAGALAGVVLSQLKKEGAIIVMPGWGGNMLDMKTTTQPYSDPDKRAIVPDFEHFLGMPMFALAGCSDSKAVDEQAAAEAAMTLMTDCLCGGNIVHDLGYLESGLCGSLAQLVICDEILDWLSHFVCGVDVSDEALALDLVDEIGPDGNFLECDHTYAHFRERWYPKLFDRDNHDGWMSRGGKTLRERAADRVTKILSEHEVEPLPRDVAGAVHAVVERAEARSA